MARSFKPPGQLTTCRWIIGVRLCRNVEKIVFSSLDYKEQKYFSVSSLFSKQSLGGLKISLLYCRYRYLFLFFLLLLDKEWPLWAAGRKSHHIHNITKLHTIVLAFHEPSSLSVYVSVHSTAYCIWPFFKQMCYAVL
jgi:hypothetical protein